MYVKNGVIFMAWKLYDEMSERNVVNWNAMISVCCYAGLIDVACEVFYSMKVVYGIRLKLSVMNAWLIFLGEVVSF